jgi:phosphoglucomutase
MSLLQEWLSSPIIAERDKRLINNLSEFDRKEQFQQHVDFGTGGIRNKMGLGPNRLNPYTIARISYGVGKTLLNQTQQPLVVIGYDTRHHSQTFARVTANTLTELGIKVCLFKNHGPTPVLSFAVRQLNAHLGIMITASHNPPMYNGYKIYDANGCQLVPHQALAFQRTMANLPNLIPIGKGNPSLLQLVGETVETAYLKMVMGGISDHVGPPLKVAFTSLHGAGYQMAKAVIQGSGHTILPVEKECIPDGHFTHIKSSNPEDNESYEGIKELFHQSPYDLGFLTDPDADRLGVIVHHHGELVALTGNQVGAIIMHDIVSNQKTIPQGFIASTIVSSDLAKKIAKQANFNVYETLTGFKYIGEQIGLRPNETFVFGYEESFGFLLNDAVRDKDAFQPMVRLLAIAAQAKKRQQSLIDLLQACYQTYGYYEDVLLTKTLEGDTGIQAIKRYVTNMANYPLGPFLDHDIIRIENYMTGIAIDRKGKEPLRLEKSDVIKFFFKEGGWIVFRPSGTEPKLKIYISLTDHNPSTLKHRFKALIRVLKNDLDSIRITA